MIAVEESSINLDTFDSSTCYPKLNYDPIIRFGIVPTCLPAVVPSACRYENSRSSYGWFGVREIRGRRKPLVGEGEDGGVQRGRSEV